MSSSIWPVLLAAVLLSGCGSLHNSQPQKNTHFCGPNAPALIQPAQVPATAAQYIACASNIDLEMYELGNPVLIGDLIAAHRRGASVKVLLDATERQSAFSGKQLAAAGIPMRYVHVPGGIDHIKLLVVDGGSAVLTGGINWGSDSTYIRDLDVLLPGDPSAAAVFSADWKAGSSGKPNEPTSSGAITGTFILSRMEDAIHVAPAGSTVEIAANYRLVGAKRPRRRRQTGRARGDCAEPVSLRSGQRRRVAHSPRRPGPLGPEQPLPARQDPTHSRRRHDRQRQLLQ